MENHEINERKNRVKTERDCGEQLSLDYEATQAKIDVPLQRNGN